MPSKISLPFLKDWMDESTLKETQKSALTIVTTLKNLKITKKGSVQFRYFIQSSASIPANLLWNFFCHLYASTYNAMFCWQFHPSVYKYASLWQWYFFRINSDFFFISETKIDECQATNIVVAIRLWIFWGKIVISFKESELLQRSEENKSAKLFKKFQNPLSISVKEAINTQPFPWSMECWSQVPYSKVHGMAYITLLYRLWISELFSLLHALNLNVYLINLKVWK